MAAKIAGLPYGQMLNELARRNIPAVRYTIEELDAELAYVRTLAGG